MEAAPEYARHSFGPVGAERVVVMIRPGLHATQDPAPAVTAEHLVRIVEFGLNADARSDPAAFGGETPGKESVRALASLVGEESATTLGLVGVGVTGTIALKVAERLGERIDRLALVGVPRPRHPLTGDLVAESLPQLRAKTLILNGTDDPAADDEDAEWYRARIANVSVTMVPGDDPFGLGDVWARVLEHCAPGTERSQRSA